MISRKDIYKLCNWLEKPKRKPLVVRGARQVGKSTLVREFAKSAGLELCEVNLERQVAMDSVFQSLDPVRIRREVEGIAGCRLEDHKTLLFLDEIQATPHALAALR